MNQKSLNPMDGWQWVVAGWGIFMRNPAMWLALTLVYVIVVFVLNMVPGVGPLAAGLLSPVLLAGFLHAAREVDEGRELNLSHLFHVLHDSALTLKLLALGLMPMAISLLSVVLIRLGLPAGAASLAVMATALLAGFAMLYALPLVIFEKKEPLPALKQSLKISLAQIAAVVVFLALALVFAVLAAIPFGLGLLVYTPVMVSAVYSSYRQVAAGR